MSLTWFDGFCREVEEIEDASIKLQDRSLKAHLNNGDADESIKNGPIEVRFLSHLVKAFILGFLIAFVIQTISSCLTF